uniref:Uncharacterized protein n=1 Tax=Brevibacterium sp. Ap13 TaxID=1406197 RepID=U5NZE2_9MICO|nr:hypothetical protein AP13_p01050 [Brevibacterium sp. Ap13]
MNKPDQMSPILASVPIPDALRDVNKQLAAEAGRPALDWTYWGIQQPSLTITADLMDAHASVGPAIYLPLAIGAGLLAIFRPSSSSTAIAGSPVLENRTADTRSLTLKSVIAKHDELLSTWDDWHNDLDLIVNFSAFHDVQHETFARTALEAHRAAEEARAKATVNDAASVRTYSTAVDEFATALKEADHQARLLGRHSIDPVLKRTMDQVQILLDTFRHPSTPANQRRIAREAIYRALDPLIDTPANIEIPELETRFQHELEPSRRGDLS